MNEGHTLPSTKNGWHIRQGVNGGWIVEAVIDPHLLADAPAAFSNAHDLLEALAANLTATAPEETPNE